MGKMNMKEEIAWGEREVEKENEGERLTNKQKVNTRKQGDRRKGRNRKI